MSKPGIKTTEFWVTVMVQVVGVVAALGLVPPEQSDVLVKAVTQVGGIVAMLASAFAYNKSRGQVKASENYAKGQQRPFTAAE
ncbi:hypothetical protein AAU61_14500 [Desulfocarbo indianensis]|nr:hypothetical protein AAU61_14500 [Desulfocarbo indianensis]